MTAKIKTLVELVEFAGSTLTVEKVGRVYEITDKLTKVKQAFVNISQCVTYIELEKARNAPIEIQPETEKQGGDALKVDTSKLVIFSSQVSSPRPSAVKSKEATAQLRKLAGKDAYDAVVDQLKYIDGEGKLKTREELKAVSTIRDEWKKFIDERALNISMNGAKVVSIHFVDEIKAKVAEVNDKLAKQASVIQAKLNDWKDDAIANGRFVDGKFPSADYFSGYGIKTRFALFGDDFDYSEEANEIKENAVSRLTESITSTIDALQKFFNGDTKSFKDASLVNLYDCANTLKESGFIESEKFVTLCDKVSEFAKDFDTDGARKSQKKISDGVKAPRTEGRGRKVMPVTSEDIDKEKAKRDALCDPLADLAGELQGLI